MHQSPLSQLWWQLELTEWVHMISGHVYRLHAKVACCHCQLSHPSINSSSNCIEYRYTFPNIFVVHNNDTLDLPWLLGNVSKACAGPWMWSSKYSYAGLHMWWVSYMCLLWLWTCQCRISKAVCECGKFRNGNGGLHGACWVGWSKVVRNGRACLHMAWNFAEVAALVRNTLCLNNWVAKASHGCGAQITLIGSRPEMQAEKSLLFLMSWL